MTDRDDQNWTHAFFGDTRVGSDPGAWDPAMIRETMRRMDWMYGEGLSYFRPTIDGLDRIPQAPTLLVANHSGGTSIPDVWGLMMCWYRRFGDTRPIHPLAHEMVFSLKATAVLFSRMGVLRASPKIGDDVLLKHGRDLLVMPGGDLDTWRPFSERYKVRFAGRKGYARLALRTGVPIVPVAHAGAHHTLFVLSDGRKLADRLGLHRRFRARIFPVHLSLPWGIGVGPLPHWPLPARLRYLVGSPISVAPVGQRFQEPPDALVDEFDAKVRHAMQLLLDELKETSPLRRARRAIRSLL